MDGVVYDGRMLRQLVLLALAFGMAQAAYFVSLSSAVATSRSMASTSWSTLGLALIVFVTAVLSSPAARAQQVLGRKTAYVLAAGVGGVGAAVCFAGVQFGSFPAFNVGMALQGAHNSLAVSYRFAASDIASPSFRPYALAMVIGGAVFAALIAPEVSQGGKTLTSVDFAGIYLLQIGFYALVALLVLLIDFTPYRVRGEKRGEEEGDGGVHGDEEDLGLMESLSDLSSSSASSASSGSSGSSASESEQQAEDGDRGWKTILQQPTYVTGLVGQTVAFSVMAFLMIGSTVPMGDAGHSFGTVTRVIQSHILGMFLPSWFLTGYLIDKLGVRPMGIVGMLGIALGGVVLMFGRGVPIFVVGLLLVGAGWNFGFVSCTQLQLSQIRSPTEQFSVQGINDFVVFGMTGVATLLTGPIVASTSWLFAILLAQLVLVLTIALLVLSAIRTRAPL